ncbi:Acetylornithine aminotransferase, mitochondrial [Linum grandiflorum]
MSDLTAAASSLNVDTTAKSGPAMRSITSKEIMEAEAKLLVGTYAKFYDLEGREFLDLTSGIAVNALGHCDSD